MNFSQLRWVGAAFASFPAGLEKGRENRISSELATGNRDLACTRGRLILIAETD
jgi:hypothetical protein